MRIIVYHIISFLVYSLSLSITAQSPADSIDEFFVENNQESETTLRDRHYAVSGSHRSSTSNVDHIYFYELINGTKVSNTASSLHYNASGTLLFSHINFISDEILKKINLIHYPLFHQTKH